MDVNIAKVRSLHDTSFSHKVIPYFQMEETLWHKFTQHQDLREELLATGDAELVEVCFVLDKTKSTYGLTSP